MDTFRAIDVLPQFRLETRSKNHRAFELADRVAEIVLDASVRTLNLSDEVTRALDMLMQQTWRTYLSVILLAERSLMEDVALLCRRLLELVVQASYIGTAKEAEVRMDRARRFLAKLWHAAPEALRQQLPAEDRARWEGWFASWRDRLPASPKSWWPTFRDLFIDLGKLEIYETDYRFYSASAHGGPVIFVKDYAGHTGGNYSTFDITVFLMHATRYCLAVTLIWNDTFSIIPNDTLDGLLKESAQTPRGLKGAA
jgi:hypothetical protein